MGTAVNVPGKSKVKVQFALVLNYVLLHEDILCLIKHHAMRTYWGSEGIAPLILDLGTKWR
jgi:hypothetical protein